MTRKRISLYVLVVVVVMVAVLAGYYFWQKRDVRPPQGTLVEHEYFMEPSEIDVGKDVRN